MTRTIPERVRWAVATLDVDPADRILELGSGPGAAISLVCERLDGGTITAIDRSPVQVARALERNREHVAAGKASVRIEELERLSVGGDRFDKIFAIDVNHFWVHPAHRELDTLRCLLKPGGRLYLFYGGTTGATKTRPLAERLAAALSERGFDATSVLRTDQPTPVLCVLGRNPDAAPIV